MTRLRTWSQSRRLGVKLIGGALTFVILTSVATSVSNVTNESEMLLERLDAFGRALTGSAAASTLEPLLVYDYPVIESGFESLMRDNPDVGFVYVQRPDGRVVAPSRPARRAPGSTFRTYTHVIAAKDAGDEILGRLVLGLSPERFEAIASSHIVRIIVQSAVVSAILAIVLGVMIKRTVANPLRQLDTYALNLGLGDMDTPIKLESHDELGRLAKTLDGMRRNLRASYDEIQAQNRLLNEAVAETRGALERAEAANRAKAQFLATISHEFRTPLNGVVGTTHLLQQTDLSTEQSEHAETIHQSADALLALITNILDYSKVDGGSSQLKVVDFDIGHVVASVVDEFAEAAWRKKLDVIEVVDDATPRTVQGDPERTRQLFANLVANAVKFTQAGEIVVRLAVLESSQEDTLFEFSVTDTGPGIPASQVASIFEPFTQVDASATRKFGGTGLGLAICRQIVDHLGGKIGVESTGEHGSRFYCSFHLSHSACAPSPSSDPRQKPCGRHVLVVDDNPSHLEVIKNALERRGATTTTAGTAAAAILAVRSARDRDRKFDLILVDAVLPDMSGADLACAVRTIAGCHSVPVVLMAGVINYEVTAAAERAGVNLCVRRPLRAAQLDAALAVDCLTRPSVTPQRAQPDPIADVVDDSGRSKVLLAEDNLINQKVTARLLRSRGMQVEIAGNGKEAVDAVARGPFQLVLMDCMMPEMDGYEATRQIRESERGLAVHTPIVALTANAIAGDRERCIAAGMDDYLSKPLDMAAFDAILDKWVSADSAGFTAKSR